MSRNRLYLIIQTVLILLLSAAAAGAAIDVCRTGLAARAHNPLSPVYTTQVVRRHLTALAPLFFITVGTTIAGRILGMHGQQCRPRHVPDISGTDGTKRNDSGSDSSKRNSSGPHGSKRNSSGPHGSKRNSSEPHGSGYGSELQSSSAKARLLQVVLVAAALIMIAAGVLNQSARDVFIKASKICTECIGLG